MSSAKSVCFIDLPNELILHILHPIPTPYLLPLAGISRRLYALVVRLYQHRLQLSANPPNHRILLECFHPTRRLMEPSLYCDYLGTPGLDMKEDKHWAEQDAKIGSLARLSDMYSHFRPYRHPERRRSSARHPAGDVPGSRTHPSTMTPAQRERHDQETMVQTLSLEGHERFGQLVAKANIACMGPKHGLFFSFVELEDRTVRVFKTWMRDAVTKGREAMLWTDDMTQKVGIKTTVVERRWRRNGAAPIMVLADEDDEPVTFDIHYEELLIRTSHLLLKLEESLLQQQSTDGKAIVFGNFSS